MLLLHGLGYILEQRMHLLLGAQGHEFIRHHPKRRGNLADGGLPYDLVIAHRL